MRCLVLAQVAVADGAMTGVTTGERAREALLASEERFRAQFKGIPVPTYVWKRVGDDFVMADYNDAADAITRGAVARLLGTTARALYADAPDILEDFERCFREKRMVRRQMPYRFRTTGEIWDFDVTFGFIPPDSVIVHTQDITERRRAEEALEKSEARYRICMEQASDGIFVTDQRGRYLAANPKACEMLGYTLDELRVLNASDVVVPEDLAETPLRFGELGAGKTLLTERRIRRKDGTVFPAEISARMLDDGTFHGIARDITERKRTEDRLERSLRELRALSARLQNIREEEAARIARQVHDEIGQSLTALAMDVEWLTNNLGRRADRNALSSKLQSMAQLVEATTEAVQRIASDLRPGVLDELGLEPAAEWAVRRFEERAGVTSRLSSRLDGAQIDSARATAAFRILQEALTNVARHAGARRVEVSLSIRGPEFHLEIQDDGVGIDTEQIADSRSLGLVGMRERARVFGGNVTIAPAAGGGTLVSAAIPLRGPGRIV